MDDLFQIDELQLYMGCDYVVNDYITMHQPTIGEIAKMGDQKYFSMVYSITATPSDMMSELDDMGVNFMDVTDYQLFLMMYKNLDKKDTSIIFGDLDFSKFNLYENTTNGEIVLYDPYTGQTLDRLAYLKISNYLRVLHSIKKNCDVAKNETTRNIMIQLDREKKSRSKKTGYHSSLKQLISAMMRYPGFKYNTKELCDCGIYEFMDTVKGAQIYVSSTALLQGSYSGMIDTKSIKQDNFNWLRDTNIE